jgi:hypothetical protein
VEPSCGLKVTELRAGDRLIPGGESRSLNSMVLQFSSVIKAVVVMLTVPLDETYLGCCFKGRQNCSFTTSPVPPGEQQRRSPRSAPHGCGS